MISNDCIALWSTEAAAEGKIAFFSMMWNCVIEVCASSASVERKQYSLTVVDLTFTVDIFLLVISVAAAEEI